MKKIREQDGSQPLYERYLLQIAIESLRYSRTINDVCIVLRANKSNVDFPDDARESVTCIPIARFPSRLPRERLAWNGILNSSHYIYIYIKYIYI